MVTLLCKMYFKYVIFIITDKPNKNISSHKLTERSLPLHQSPPPVGSSVKEGKVRGQIRVSSEGSNLFYCYGASASVDITQPSTVRHWFLGCGQGLNSLKGQSLVF